MSTDEVFEQIKGLWQSATAVEPVAGVATREDVKRLRGPLEALQKTLQQAPDDELGDAFAPVLARCAVVAVAAGDASTGHDWMQAAQRITHDADSKALYDAALRKPEDYRALVHGRYLIARGRERKARSLWKAIAKGESNALKAAARDELAAPRPLEGKTPTLHRINGIGAAFYGSRDRANDSSYVTTHCISVLWVPVFPLGAYRVRDNGTNSYYILAREQLSGFAKAMRIGIPALIAMFIAVAAIQGYLEDPSRLGRKHFVAALDKADGEPAEAALTDLDHALTGPDFYYVGDELAQRAGAQVVRLTASLLPKPFTAASLDQARRVVLRFQSLPPRAQGGPARETMLATIDEWANASKDAETKLAVLRFAATVADGHGGDVTAKLSAARIAYAKAEAQDWPLDALGVLVEDAHDKAALAEASPLVTKLAASPSLLDDAGPDLDVWLASRSGDADAVAIGQKRDEARAARDEDEAETATPKSLADKLKQRPWDQRAIVALARLEIDAGKHDAAAKRLNAIGAPGLIVRDGRFLLAKIALAQDQLEVADALLTRLLGSRLRHFIEVSAALDGAEKRVEERVDSQLKTGSIPSDLERSLQNASESEQHDLVMTWAREQITSDPDIKAKREAFMPFADVVPTAVAAGTVKLRRGQAMSGAARDAMLADAEKTFLAVRTQAEGQPEFQLGLGEIYARLGKTKESDAAFKEVLDRKEPQLTLAVAGVYRSVGSVARAKEIAVELFGTATSPIKEQTAVLLGLLTANADDQERESESWFRKADQKSSFVKVSLLELEGRRLLREGKFADCDRKFAETARIDLAEASARNTAGFNNAALAHAQRFSCSGDVTALRDAEAALEQAYRVAGEDPIVVGNYSALLQSNAKLRAIAKRVDTKTLRLDSRDADELLGRLLESPERDGVLADLAADASWRRAPELLGHAEVLAPSETRIYEEELARAAVLRDVASAASAMDRMRHAKALDTSMQDTAWKRWTSGDNDESTKQQLTTSVAHYTAVLASSKLDAHTRAAALYLQGAALHQLGAYFGDPEDAKRAHEALAESTRLWPALADEGGMALYLVDEAALRIDAKHWRELRHDRSTTNTLAKLVETNDPLAGKIRSSPQWAEVIAHAKANTARPTLPDLRLARVIGDAALEARDKAVHDDKLARLQLELRTLEIPSDKDAAGELAYFDKP